MLKNYIRIAWRNLRKNRVSSLINIAGLATGMAITLLIGLWITDELSFDKYHANYHRIAKGMTVQNIQGQAEIDDVVCMPLGASCRTQYKDLFSNTALMCGGDEQLITSGDKKLNARGIWAQKELPEMFTFHMLKGTIASEQDPSTALISQSLATALFGSADPINKTITVGSETEFKIGGVFDDLPQNTTFYGIKLIKSWYNKANSYHNSDQNWDDHNGYLYVELAPGITAEQATARIKSLPTPNIKGWLEQAMIYPLDKFHLHNEFKNGNPDGGRIRFVQLFGIIGAFVLLLACINFMNLSTARSEKRAKEVGIRKTLGSLKSQLITQFLSESVLVAVLAFLISLCLAQLALPFFNDLAAKKMVLPWGDPWFWTVSLAFVFFTGILAGSYPAFYLSHYDPIQVLKSSFRAGSNAFSLRQVLVVLQFTVSLTLIIGTIIVFQQISFTKDRPVGYNREGLLSVYMNTPNLWSKYDVIRQDLLRTGVVENVAQTSMKPTEFGNSNNLDWRGKRPDQAATFFRDVNVSPDFGKTIGWHITKGRDFSHEYGTDTGAMILNEKAAKTIGIKDPIGETMSFYGQKFTVIGIANDMVVNSPYDTAQAAIFMGKGWHSYILVRIKTNQPIKSALTAIQSVFNTHNPGSPFVYNFIDEEYSRKFEAEQRIGNLAAVFTALAIFISCIGLFGLASFVAEQRTKELGVRKVLGASIFTLWSLQSKSFIKLVLISFCVAMPLAYIAMQKWLEGYVYRTGLSWWIFAASGLGILLVTMLTVSVQSLRAATMSPTKSLRTE